MRKNKEKASQTVASFKPMTINLQTRPFSAVETEDSSSSPEQIKPRVYGEFESKQADEIMRKLTDETVERRSPVHDVVLRRTRERFAKLANQNANASMPIQAKLNIGEPNDKYEQEADRTAAQVVQQINSTPQDNSVQKQESMEENDQKLQMKSLVQRRENLDGGEASTDLESSIQSARGGGRSLAPNLQAKMGEAMGADFSGVKVHTDSQSDQLNRSIQAKAFTTGKDVFFRQGAYQPQSRGGQELIAHELTHVAQQNMLTVPTIQRYAVLGSKKIFNAAPKSRPRFGYPYAIANGGSLLAQTPLDGVDDGDKFLDSKGSDTANTETAGKGFSLRVSSDNKMAVEDSDLTNRQPKVFFTTKAVIQASNQSLLQVNSQFSLVEGGKTVKILPDRQTVETLYEVTPLFNNGSPDLAPQNCNAMGAAVGGKKSDDLVRKDEDAFDLAKSLAPNASYEFDEAWKNPKIDIDPFRNQVAKEYISNRKSAKGKNMNQYAMPNVGETYMINTIGTGTNIGGKQRVRDYQTNKDLDLGWSFHFGGVVAQSGGDRITLENYARGDNRGDNADPRWYFQMYGTKKKQTYHEVNRKKKEYANALTIVV